MNLKSHLTLLFVFAFSLFGHAQFPFTLNAKVPEGLNGQKVFLVVYGDYTDHIIEKSFLP